MLDVVDVVSMVNDILQITVRAASYDVNDPAVVSLNEVKPENDGRSLIPLFIDTDVPVAAAQMTFSFDPAKLKPEQPFVTDDRTGYIVESHVEGSNLHVVVYTLQPGRVTAGYGQPFLQIPITYIGDEAQTSTVTLSDVILATPAAQRLPVTVSGSRSVISQTPSVFSLEPAYPNPFNPSTHIAYEVPQQTHVALTVYNLLGQEVVRLVDEVQVTGRYEVVWHGVNRQGVEVASGLYLYQITTGTGYSETRKMMLLK